MKKIIEMIPLNEKTRKIQYEINKTLWNEHCYLKFNNKVEMLMQFLKFIFSFYDNLGNVICKPSEYELLRLKEIIIEPSLLYDCEICDEENGIKLDKLHALLAYTWNEYLCKRDVTILKNVKYKLLYKPVLDSY